MATTGTGINTGYGIGNLLGLGSLGGLIGGAIGGITGSLFRSGNNAGSNAGQAPATFGGTQQQAQSFNNQLNQGIQAYNTSSANMSVGQPNLTYKTLSNTQTQGTSLNNTMSGTQAGYVAPDFTYADTQTQTGSTSSSTQNTQRTGLSGQQILSGLTSGTQQQTQYSPEQQQYLSQLAGYSQQLQQIQSRTDENYNRELNQINAQFANLKNQQEQENRYRTESARQLGISSGLASATPQIYSSQIANIVDSGLQKIADYTIKQNGLVLQADNANIEQKTEILSKLKALDEERYNTIRQMKDDIYTEQQRHEKDITTKIEQNIPAIYDYLNTLSPQEQSAYKMQVANTLGVPITRLESVMRDFTTKENQSVISIYNQIASKVANDNPALALEIAQKSMTPEGRKELMNSPYLQSLAATNQIMNTFTGGYTSSVSGPINWDALMNVHGQFESGNKYTAVNKTSGALGRFQVMPEYLKEFTTLANKQFGTPILDGTKQADRQAFLNNPQLQDAVYKAKMGYNLQQLGGDLELGIASWFSGLGGARKYQQGLAGNLSDGQTTVPQYVKNVLSGYLSKTQGGSTGGLSKEDALAQAKQNLSSLGGTRLSLQSLQSINNRNTLWNKAVSSLGTAQEKQDAYGSLAMSKIVPKLVELRQLIGEEQFGLLASSDQKFRQLYGGTRGQEVSRLMSQITNLLQQNRSQITGAAWGAKEDKEYLMKLPAQKDSVASYFGKLQGLLDTAQLNAQSTVGNVIGGDDVFNTLYGDMFTLNNNQSQVGGGNNFSYGGMTFQLPY